MCGVAAFAITTCARALLPGTHELHRVADRADGRHAPSGGVKKAVHGREEHERVRTHELHDEGREPVVVAEREPLELLVRHHVVLVHDGHDARAHEMVERTAHVRGAPAVVEVGVREQHLADLHARRAEEVLVFGDEARLAHGRAHLHLHAGRDRAGGDENDLKAGFAKFAELADETTERPVVRTPRLRGDRVRADLDDHAAHVLKGRALAGDRGTGRRHRRYAPSWRRTKRFTVIGAPSVLETPSRYFSTVTSPSAT